MTRRRVVITGLGVITNIGQEVDLFWNNLLAGKCGLSALEGFDTEAYPVKIGGQVKDFNPDKYIDPRESKRIDRFAQFALAAAVNAVADSGIDFSKEDPEKCGCIIGSGIGGLGEIEREHVKLLEKGPRRVSPFCVPKLMANAANANVGIRFGLKGANYAVLTACAAATHAVGDALRQIQYGYEDVIITGGAEAAVTNLGLASFCALKALSTRNDEPLLASRPFDAERDGFVLAEGAGIVVLEEYEHAKKRGATIYAEVVGFGMSCDAYHITAPCEDGSGAARCIKAAIRDSGLNPDQIDYINAHGTSTELNDKAETMAVKTALGEANARKVSLSSIKSHVGHSLGASGGIELVATALTVKNGIIPPTINLVNPDPLCDLDYTPLVAKNREVKFALSNSFGFGGHNASVAIGKI
ncbi:MAG: beta-ketoacyl-ACP synthase II [Sedimentisphaerales bacterium]|nr:beta-ketoacyl-ACP synthase II [Sedimentisphaerales bacterium]